jgi:hypothetical protein
MSLQKAIQRLSKKHKNYDLSTAGASPTDKTKIAVVSALAIFEDSAPGQPAKLIRKVSCLAQADTLEEAEESALLKVIERAGI